MRTMLVIVILCLAGPAAAQDPGRGAELFSSHCAACHGPEAEGAGPMADILRVVPPDLSALAAAEGGAFPMERVVRAIDGRTTILSHGGAHAAFWAHPGRRTGR
jgi:mono/diheme cytochrome c family protein